MRHFAYRIAPWLAAAALVGCSDGGSPGNGDVPGSQAQTPARTPTESQTEGPQTAASQSLPAQSAAPSGSAANVPPAFPRKPAPEGARVYIVAPEDGAVVSNPVRVVFGLSGMGVAPAGIAWDDAGHHHLLIDTDPPALSAPIPSDDRHVHFGLGQTETELTLEPGEHRLQLLLGDEVHVPHEPPVMSEPITITVR